MLENHVPLCTGYREQAYQVQYGNLHHALVEVCCSVLDHLDGHDLLRLQVLALDDLTKGTLTQNIEDEVSVPGRQC